MKKLVGRFLYSILRNRRGDDLNGDPGLTRTGDLLLRRKCLPLLGDNSKFANFSNLQMNPAF